MTQKKFKVGDRVRLVGGLKFTWSETSLIGTISEQHPDCSPDRYTIIFDYHPTLGKKPCYNFYEEGLISLEVYESPLMKALS